MILRLALEVLRWGIGPLLLCRLTRLDAGGGRYRAGDADLAVAVVIPARNEAARIGPLLASLRMQTPPPAEVVVVDDASTDGTADVARAAGFHVLAAPPRPPDWNGKQWACHSGAEATTAPLLCFVDADVELSPGALDMVAAEVERGGGLVSVQPHHVTGSVAEGLSLLPNLVSMMATDAFGPLGDSLSPSGAFGPVLACKRVDHEAAGGHAGVRSAVMEDIALAGAYRRSGLPVTIFAGGPHVRFRMHDGGVAAVVEGWTRGLADGARRVRVLTLVGIVVWLSGVASAPLVALERPALGAGLSAAYALQLWWLSRRIGHFPVTAWLLYPAGVVFFLMVFLRSVGLMLVGGKVTWKDRRLRP